MGKSYNLTITICYLMNKSVLDVVLVLTNQQGGSTMKMMTIFTALVALMKYDVKDITEMNQITQTKNLNDLLKKIWFNNFN
jgi:hypothetical protein